MEPILKLLHQPVVVSQLTAEYFNGFAYGLIPSLIITVFIQFFMGIARPKIILKFTASGVLINSFASYLLIYGFEPIKPLGIFGAGLATAITSYIQLSLILLYILFNKGLHKYTIKPLAVIDLSYCKKLLKIGTPISIQYTTEILAFSSVTYLMGLVGMETLAAQQITVQCTMFALIVVMGISQSGSILISHNINKDLKLNRAIICKFTVLIGMASMAILGIVYWLSSDFLINLYIDNNHTSFDAIAALAKDFLILAAITQCFDSARNISSGLLRGYGDTKFSMQTGIISCWFIGIPLGVIFAFAFHFNGIGLRLGMMIGLLYGCVHLIYRLIRINAVDFSVKPLATDMSL